VARSGARDERAGCSSLGSVATGGSVWIMDVIDQPSGVMRCVHDACRTNTSYASE